MQLKRMRSTAAPAVVRRALAPNPSRDARTKGFGCPHRRANDEGVVGCARGAPALHFQLNRSP